MNVSGNESADRRATHDESCSHALIMLIPSSFHLADQIIDEAIIIKLLHPMEIP
jgi:hypothetical protein